MRVQEDCAMPHLFHLRQPELLGGRTINVGRVGIMHGLVGV
jgi:hypothetical protein